MKKRISIRYALLLVLSLFLVGCPPFSVIIHSPLNGAQFEVGQEITFSGSAHDFQDWELTDDLLVWTSSIDDEIGTGTEFTIDSLEEGTHTITLTAKNSLGEEGIVSITITIGGGTSTTTTTSLGTGAIVLSTDTESDLLFYVIHEDGSGMYYYGFNTNGSMELTHVISDDGTIAIFNEDLIPIQWISNGLTVVVYRENDEEPFDPHSAYHEVLYDGNEDSFTIDIYPENLSQVVSDMETCAGQEFNDASAFLTTYNISSFDELVALAKQNGQEQARYIAAAVGFSASAAFLSMDAEGFGSGQFSSIIPLQYNYLIKYLVGLLASKFNDTFGPGSTDPDGPVVEVALCRGVASYGICHYLFFHMEDYGTCIEKCLTSMRCFTDICMPGYTISAEVAKKCRDHYMGEE
jgi:hypothetical protein